MWVWDKNSLKLDQLQWQKRYKASKELQSKQENFNKLIGRKRSVRELERGLQREQSISVWDKGWAFRNARDRSDRGSSDIMDFKCKAEWMNLKYVATVISVLLELDSTSLLNQASPLLIENELDMKPVKFWKGGGSASTRVGVLGGNWSDMSCIPDVGSTRKNVKRSPLFEQTNQLSWEHPREATSRVPNLEKGLISPAKAQFEVRRQRWFWSGVICWEGLPAQVPWGGQSVKVLGSEETATLTVTSHLSVFPEQEKGYIRGYASFTFLREERNQ